MNRSVFGLASVLALLLLVCGCAIEPAGPHLATARLSLDNDVLFGVDRVTITVEGPEGILGSQVFNPPFAAETIIELPPGLERRVDLRAEIGEQPAWRGTSAPTAVPEGALVDVELVLDSVGWLSVEPLGVPPENVEAVEAVPRDPHPDLPDRYLLVAADGAHTETLPVGTYDLEFTFSDGLDLVPGAPPVVEVRQAVETHWREPFTPRAVPPPPPGPPVRIEVAVVGGYLLAGLLPLAADVQVRLRDIEGRIAVNYAGDVDFASPSGLLGLLVAASVPERRTFTPADQGEHLFRGGLLAPVSLLAGLLRLVVTADVAGAPIQTELDVPVRVRLL